MNQETKPIILFYSYSHKDEKFRNELANHLVTLKNSGFIGEWYDRKILPGDEWDKEISKYLDSADVILLLISSDFLASKYINDVEAKRALERHSKNEANVIPIILRPVGNWRLTQFSQLQALPTDARPVTIWKPKESAYVDICEGIFKVVMSLRNRESGGDIISNRPSIKPHIQKPIIQPRERVLDAALPEKVEIGKAAALVAMIRTEGSVGLRGILKERNEYGLNEKDVISTDTFQLEFPLDFQGKPQPLDLTLKIESPDFEPPIQTKSLRVLPKGDSDVRIFLLTPKRKGELLVNAELYKKESLLTNFILKTTALETTPNTGTPNLTSIPLKLATENLIGSFDDRILGNVKDEYNSVSDDRATELGGKWEQIKGSVKEGVGNLTGDRDLEAVGEAQQTGGDLQEGWGKVKRGAGETLPDIGDAMTISKTGNKMITGIFRDRESAERAYRSLESRGYSRDDINLMMSDDTRNNWFGNDADNNTELGYKALEGAGAGSAIGGTVGTVIAAMAAIGTNVVIPGLGLVIAGPLAAALAGAGAGGLSGGLIGALVGSGIPEDRAKEYEEGIRNGGIVMGVNPRSDEDADYFEQEWRDSRGEAI